MKKTLSMLLAVVVLALCIPGAALATNETEGTTALSFTYTLPAPEDEYIINIPSQYIITGENYMEITASKMDIGSDKRVIVSLDPTKNAMDGNTINLISGNNSNAVRCEVFAENALYSEGTRVSVVNTSYRVAIFKSNTPSIPNQYGRVYVIPEIDSGTAEGTYTGTLHFDIALVS